MPTPIDLETWPRRATYDFFKDYDDPFYNVCADVEVGTLLEWCRSHQASFFLASLHASLRAVHAVKELLLRIDGEGVLAYERLRGGSTVLNEDESFSFVYFDFHPRLEDFIAHGEAVLENHRKRGPSFEPGTGADVIYYSVVPWIHFRSISHARNHRTGDSVPKITFGKYRREADLVMLPVSIEVHHALVDGLHVGRFFEHLQAAFDNPDDDPQP